MRRFLMLAAIAAPACAQPGAPLPAAATATIRYAEDFSDGRGFETRWVFGGTKWPNTIQTRTLANNKERELYVGGNFGGLGIDPYSVAGGVLTIAAAPLPARAGPRIDALVDQAKPGRLSERDKQVIRSVTHSSGLLASTGHFEGGYGYYEARLKIPTGKGDWPAFWLYDWNYKVEIDIMESVGDKTNCYHATLHSPYPPTKKQTTLACASAPLSAGYHLYGALVTAKDVTFYLDRREVARFPALTGYKHARWSMLLNLAEGGWPGDPAPDHRAELKADYVHVYAAPEASP